MLASVFLSSMVSDEKLNINQIIVFLLVICHFSLVAFKICSSSSAYNGLLSTLCLSCFDSCILYPWISLINFGKFSSIISLKFFPLSFSSGILITFIYDYIYHLTGLLATVHFVSFYFSVFLTFYNFYCSVFKFSYLFLCHIHLDVTQPSDIFSEIMYFLF